jgi:hypothetical protein
MLQLYLVSLATLATVLVVCKVQLVVLEEHEQRLLVVTGAKVGTTVDRLEELDRHQRSLAQQRTTVVVEVAH